MVPDEEALRRLQAVAEGTDPEPQVSFLDGCYEVGTTGRLAPLLRYAMLGQQPAAERARLESLGEDGAGQPGEQAMLAAAHQLLEETLADFAAFSAAALAGKASLEDVRGAVMRVIEVITARPPMTGLRLLRYVAGNLAEMDGTLLLAGRGLAALSAREACNAAFARCLEAVDPERRTEWIEDLYLDYDPDSRALDMVRQMQAAQAAEAVNGDGQHSVGHTGD